MIEIWNRLNGLVDFGDYYEISNFGNIRSIDRTIDKRSLKGKILKQREDKDGYLMINLNLGGKKKTYKIHRLVAISFLQNLENKPEVNHKDGIKTNNNIDNLEWSTSKENIDHAYENSLIYIPKGEEKFNSKLKEKDVVKMRKMYVSGNYTYKELGKIFNTSEENAWKIIKNQRWKHV